jgi:pimeloyl-ACP methyl ester carboxylesterase
MHLFYLHGFASSAGSTKAAWLAERLAPFGLSLHCPDFNQPDFHGLTTSRMIGQVDDAIAALPSGPVVLIGSSLGGFVAWHAAARQSAAAARRTPIERLVLLAPALDFGANRRMGDLDADGIDRWRDAGYLDVFHHAFGETLRVGYELYADAAGYDSFAVQDSDAPPTVIFQGRRDDAVDPAMVQRFSRGRAAVELHLLDDDHQLHDSLELIWRRVVELLELEPGA